MRRRVLVVESGSEWTPVVSDGVAELDPAIEVDHASSVSAAVNRLAAQGYDLIVSASEFDGARAGVFLRHLCARRFPGTPFLLLHAGDDDGATASSPAELLQRVKRLL